MTTLPISPPVHPVALIKGTFGRIVQRRDAWAKWSTDAFHDSGSSSQPPTAFPAVDRMS